MKLRLIFLLLFIAGMLPAQNRNSVWCFGDSALIDFSDTANIVTGISSVKSRGSCATICDTSGQLLFYVSYDLGVLTGGTDPVKAYNRNHQIMLNGDSMKGAGWYREISIIPDPGSDSLYYVFYVGVTNDYGIYYSIVNMNGDNGLGEVIQKNIQLQSFQAVDCIGAIKHGNGRDWWVIFRRFISSFTGNNEYYCYLISPAGVGNVSIQNVGSLIKTNIGQIVFNSSGSQFNYINSRGLMELNNFDRCTGIISNPQTIFPEQNTGLARFYWCGQFSQSDGFFYTTSLSVNANDTNFLVQYNMTLPNIPLSADTLWTTPFMKTMGHLKLAPNNKIFLSNSYYQIYPYADSMYNTFNMNLGVINSPDLAGAACNFQPYSFYLGGTRAYTGLPQNPNYELGALIGSPCDTITGITQTNELISDFFIYYAPNWQTVFINAQKLTGKNYSLEVFDAMSKKVFEEEGFLNSPYFTKNLNYTSFAKGIYLVRLTTEKEKLVKKFVKE